MYKKTILKNISWLTLQEIPSQFIGIFFYMILAREWGQSVLGLYAYIFSLMTIVALILDFGFANMFWRKWSTTLDSLQSDISNVLGARLALITIISVCLLVYVLKFDRGWSIYLLLAYVYTLLDSIRMIPILFFQAKNDFKRVFVINIIDRILPLLIGILVIYFHGTLIMVFIGLLISRLCSLLISVLLFPTLLCVRPRIINGMKLLPSNFVIFVIGLLTFVYFKVDTIMIRLLLDIRAVGLYSSVYRIIDSLVVIPTFFIFAAFPTLTKLHVSSAQTELNHLLDQAMKYLSIMSVFIAVFFTFYANEIISFLYKDAYLKAAPSLQILGWAVVFYFLTSPLVYSIFSSKKDGFLLTRLLTLTLANVGMNILFIPRFGISGAALSTLITEMISFTVLTFYSHLRFSISWIIKLGIVALILSGVLLKIHYLLFPTLIVGGALYLTTLYILKVFRPQELLKGNSA